MRTLNEFSRPVKEKYSNGTCSSFSASRTFTGVRYIVNLTDTINQNELRLTNLERDVGVLEKNITDINTRLSSAEATWQMAENLYRQLADQVREHDYDIKDLNR